MNRFLICALIVASASGVFAWPAQQRQQPRSQETAPRGRAAVRRALVEDAIYAFYVKQFQQDGDVSPEALAKILPFIEQFLHERFAISQRRTQALNQLRLAVTRNAPEEELKRWVRDIDTADADFQSNQEKFLNNVDPLLTARQQAKVRILQTTADNRIRQMLNAVQNAPAGQRQNNPPVTSQN